MTLFDNLIKQATEFVEKHKEGWDHTAWLDFLSSIQNTGIKVTEEVQNYLGVMLESIRKFNQNTFPRGKKVTDILNEQISHFIHQTKGIWDHSGWENFVTDITQKGVRVTEDAVSNLGEILESAKKLYFSLPFANKDVKKGKEVGTKKAKKTPQQPLTEVTEETPAEQKEEPQTEVSKEQTAVKDAASEVSKPVEKEEETDFQPIKSHRLTKKLLMELDEGMFLVSRSVSDDNEPIFVEEVSQLSEREEQWKRIISASANQRACQVFTDENTYKIYHAHNVKKT
jgi:hypothetical protein